MPYSDQCNQPWVIEQLRTLELTSMLDVGAGSGTYGHIFTEHFPDVKRVAVEAWMPYIDEFNLHFLYTELFNRDIRDQTYFEYDLVIFGDILEHMTKDEALDVWDKVSSQAKYALLAIPIVYMPQDDVNGNPYEKHIKDDWTHDEVLATFPQITKFITADSVGSYLAEF